MASTSSHQLHPVETSRSQKTRLQIASMHGKETIRLHFHLTKPIEIQCGARFIKLVVVLIRRLQDPLAFARGTDLRGCHRKIGHRIVIYSSFRGEKLWMLWLEPEIMYVWDVQCVMLVALVFQRLDWREYYVAWPWNRVFSRWPRAACVLDWTGLAFLLLLCPGNIK